MKKVLIVQTQMKQYRAPLWAQLHDSLRRDGIELTVAYSDPPEADRQKNDNCELPADYGKRVRGIWLWPGGLLYQPLLRCAVASDLVILQQSNRVLLNHLLLLLSRLAIRRVASWGNGADYQASRIRLSDWYRRETLTWAYWWFAYTSGTARYLEAHGVPSSKITILSNSIDTREIREHIQTLTTQDRAALRSKLGIPVSAPVGIFCGMLDKAKGLSFLIDSSTKVKAQIPEFHLILVGGGTEQNEVSRLTYGLNWVHWVGPQFGKDKAELMAISDALLLPGRVGLGILDAFAAGLPLITIRGNFHAPEIEYLQNGINGLISDARPEAFAETVSSVLSHTDLLLKLRAAAFDSGKKYSIENMAENFRSGIRSCLGLTEPNVGLLGLQKAN